MHNKVIAIDDSQINCMIIEQLIKKNAFSNAVVTFTSGAMALAYLHSVKNDPAEYPDVIFLDISMPEMNGYDFMDKYEELPQAMKDACTIAAFTSFRENELERIKNYPLIKKYLHKPLTNEMLASFDEV